jgi:hypothetical protein
MSWRLSAIGYGAVELIGVVISSRVVSEVG